MRIVKIKFGIGFGRHTEEIEFEDGTPDAEIEQAVQEYITEKLDYGFEIEDEPDVE